MVFYRELHAESQLPPSPGNPDIDVRRLTIEIDECITFLDTQLPSRILTSRASLRNPYQKSDPSGYRFGAVSPQVRATLQRENHFGQNGALAWAWCSFSTRRSHRLSGGHRGIHSGEKKGLSPRRREQTAINRQR